MKKQSFNFKDLKGTLTRDEMRALKGGDDIVCESCKFLTPAQCLAICISHPVCLSVTATECCYCTNYTCGA